MRINSSTTIGRIVDLGQIPAYSRSAADFVITVE